MDRDGDLLKDLVAEHDEIRALCGVLAGLQYGDGQRKVVLDQLAALLEQHTEIEEACLYPLVRRLPENDAIAAKGLAEHRAIATLVDELAWRSELMPGFESVASLLVSQVTAHLGEEEATTFEVAGKAAPHGELARLGRRARQLRGHSASAARSGQSLHGSDPTTAA